MPRRINDLPKYKPVRRALRTDGTPAEAALWTLLKRRQLQGRRFRRQHSVRPYVLDFYCPEERLAVELDGSVHFEPARRAYDAARERGCTAGS
jgi:very-short-patch-repair endonuclease